MSEQQPDTTRIFSLLCRLSEGDKVSLNEIHELVEIMNTMSGSNVMTELASFKEVVLSRLESTNAKMDMLTESTNAKMDTLTESTNAKIDTLNESTNAKIDTLNESANAKMDVQNSKYNILLWVIGSFGGTVTILLTIGTFFQGG